ncbi:MAG: nuclear transport factor 2 family protein [Pyrinomonadaceae bacterium]
MNETNNTRIVRQGYERFGNGDLEGLLQLFDENIEWTTPITQRSSLGGTRRGRQAVAEFFGLLVETENITRFEPTEFIAQGDRVVVLGKSAATVNATGRSYETDWIQIFTVRNEKVTGFYELFDTAAVERAFQKAEAA